MPDSTCACPACTCKVGPNAIVRHGKQYCCMACADHHADGAPCVSHDGCKCAEGSEGG
ncbi:metallothionein [Pseudomonas sp. MAFF 302030]|jgi:metallothionein|uniref:Metallothionein n=1 Tax=Pseudomonas morbosilactucae TaxID=2938197 RepID=A0A9X1YX18_9PSED|nr:metallothionein [Pseudomonas morbosilactucae]MCK9799833.1 metallothionein [Pseudomonas morbosilactucae]MCK9818445.1 metallothionein [Pseudomonas morbosilactucae]